MTPAQLAKGFRGAADEAQPKRLRTRILVVLEHEIKVETPVRSGALRRSITQHADSDSRGRVGTNLHYGVLVHDGTKPHVMVPTAKRALAWPGGQHPVKRVQHPGTKANPFLTRGAQRARGAIDRELEQHGQQIVGRVTRG